MFTGIIEELGTVTAIERGDESATFTIQAQTVLVGTRIGDSIDVSGTCLSVTSMTDSAFTADVMHETLEASRLGLLTVGDRVNLERAARVDSRLGGHIVQGHTDAVGRVLARTPGERWEVVRVELPSSIARFVAYKGSITVDGVSLTVSGLGDDWFEVSLIPETLTHTTLGGAPVGSPLNLESDVLARHLDRLLAAERTSGEAHA